MKNNILSYLRKTLFVVFLLSTTMLTYAQTVITGVVVDAATAEPIIGANVIIQGTTNGTITDFDGNFILSVEKGATLEISYMGYKSVTVPAADGLKVELGEDTELLDEVVVVGYGVVKKNDATGSVTAIKPDEMNKGLQTNAQDMIQGKIAGVNITTSDGSPGGGAAIRIRGGSSLNASNDPLIVIDGLAMDNNGIHIRYIHARLNDRSGYQYVIIIVDKLLQTLFHLASRHLAVCNHRACLWTQTMDAILNTR